jgi:NCAIR mutase (PurE)-related protein
MKGFANLDLFREARKGVPEIVLAEGKGDGHLKAICEKLYRGKGRVIISRVSKERAGTLGKLGPSGYNEAARMLVIKKKGFKVKKKGKVGILAAGTADVGVAEEARIVAEELGCEVVTAYDVGVAGIHRLDNALKKMKGCKAIIVVAGMEGALASVVAGLVDCLVIGVPVSTGYGYGGKGEAALMSMLQSCSPGLVVVNIDNGVGAGVAAAMVAG